MMKKVTIKQRREKVAIFLTKTKTEKEIALKLGVSRQTIVRDVAYLKKESQKWLDDLAKEGFVYEFKLTLDKIRDHERELHRLYTKSDDISQKIQILKALNENAKLYLELLGETPTVHAYKKAMKRIQNV